ncbi:hypothetical protein HUJ04_000400 [Dendroctonus ponderosae]|nr:hypothetical protein HUJ04_000400 [Dendroctonus ponderosae]
MICSANADIQIEKQHDQEMTCAPTSLAASTLYIAVSCTVLSQIFVLSWISNEIEVEFLYTNFLASKTVRCEISFT